MLNERRRPDWPPVDEIRPSPSKRVCCRALHARPCSHAARRKALAPSPLEPRDDEQRSSFSSPANRPPSGSCFTTIFRRSALVKWIYAWRRTPRNMATALAERSMIRVLPDEPSSPTPCAW